MYDLVTFSSMGVRITPVDRQPVGAGHLYEMQSTSAETNVLNISAALGLSAKVYTAFVKGSPIAGFIKGELRRRNIQFEGPEMDDGGPWGYRHQFNIADAGYGLRGPRVSNDRAGEVGRVLAPEHFDVQRIFREEGVRMVHLSGLIAALSPQTSALCLRMAQEAKSSGARVSFDLNYRASFWKGRETELREIFTRIAQEADILIGNEEDFQLALGIQGVEAGGKDILGKAEAFREIIENARAAFPNAKVFATTLRQVVSANEHLWGAILYMDGQWQEVQPRPIQVLDRIGGGDGFVGGLLYGLLKGWPGDRCLPFAWATGVLAVTVLTDYATPQDEEQVWSIWEGNARVKR